MTVDLVIFGVRTPIADPKAVLADLRAYMHSKGGWAQILNPESVFGRDHLVSALGHARRAIEQGRNTTDSVEMEFLLYVSGERQISKAIEAAGAKAQQPFVVVIPGGESAEDVLLRFSWERDDKLLDPTGSRLRGAGFSTEEIESAGESARDLILERVARVDLIK